MVNLNKYSALIILGLVLLFCYQTIAPGTWTNVNRQRLFIGLAQLRTMENDLYTIAKFATNNRGYLVPPLYKYEPDSSGYYGIRPYSVVAYADYRKLGDQARIVQLVPLQWKQTWYPKPYGGYNYNFNFGAWFPDLWNWYKDRRLKYNGAWILGY